MTGTMVLLAAVILRLLPRLVWPRLPGSDQHFHNYACDEVWRTGFRMPYAEPRVLGGPNLWTYPLAFHRLFAWLPRALRAHVPLACDLVTASCASSMTPSMGADTAHLLTGLYILQPCLTAWRGGPRAWFFTPRPFSQMCFALAWVSLAHWHWVQAGYALGVMLAASQFGLQALLTLAPLLGPQGLTAVAAAPLAAMAVSCGRFTHQVRDHLGHLEWYLKRGMGHVAHVSPARVAKRLVTLHVPFLAALAVSPSPLLCAAAATAALTSFGPMRVLGESERYAEFAAPMAWAALWAWMPADWLHPATAVTGLYCLAHYANAVRQMRMDVAVYRPHLLDDALWHIRHQTTGPVLPLCATDAYAVLEAASNKVYGFLTILTVRGYHAQWYDETYYDYARVRPEKVDEICRRWGISLVLQNRISPGAEYELANRYRVFYSNPGYTVWQVPGAQPVLGA